ncbi:MAG: hypothetical protein ACTSVU_06545 [Promethearchaeota archaeon]
MLRYRNLTIIPTYHSSLDFVHEVRKSFYKNPPNRIAIEFPENLKTKIEKGISRLPAISIIVYFDEILQEQLFVPIIPTDSLIEAIRLSTEYGIPVEYIDLFVKNYTPEILQMPDSNALNYLSLEKFYQLVNSELKLEKRAKQKILRQNREQLKHLQQLNKEADLLESEGKETTKIGKNAQDWTKKSNEIDSFRENYMASRLKKMMEKHPKENIMVVLGLSHWESIKARLEYFDYSPIPDRNFPLEDFSIDINSEIFNVLQTDLPKIMIETPNIAFQFEQFRSKQKDAIDGITHQSKFILKKYDIFTGIKEIILASLQKFKKNYHEQVSVYKLKSLFQYMRNLPVIDGKIQPLLFDIVLAAKSIVNDDFAWIVWEECKRNPYAIEDPKLDSIDLTNKGIFLHGKFFKLRRSLPIKFQKMKLPLKPRPEEKKKGEWRTIWNKNGWNLVSHIPEDLFEENYFRHVRKRALGIVKDQNLHIHEFKSTMMDGIAIRETLRNWVINQKIYVKEERTIRSSVDAVVIIFDRDEVIEPKYLHTMMWYAEHEKESDLAFYSTIPGQELVGPGISRIELGGVVSFFPPRGVPDIWTREFEINYPFAKNKADRLLLAAILFAQKKFITYSAKSKPSSKFYSLAAYIGIKIIYLPLDHFNPVSLHSLRNLHIIAGKKARSFAERFIKKRRF